MSGNKKPKIELRPGPAKPSNASSVSSKTVAAQLQATSTSKPSSPKKPPPLAATAPKEEVLKEFEGAGMIEATKKDVDDAAKHGILAPPPPDAGMVGRLIHQAKELFVGNFFGPDMTFLLTTFPWIFPIEILLGWIEIYICTSKRGAADRRKDKEWRISFDLEGTQVYSKQ